MTKALSKPDSPAVVACRRREEKIVQRSEKIVATALRAPELPDEAELDENGRLIVPDGWTEKEYRIAMAGKAPARNKPAFLELAAQVTMNAQKLAIARGQVAELALKVVEFTEKKREYPVLDVTPVEVENG